ncbi:MAG: hypothetical protein M5U22_06510 [Thermoleophilia bacterium]|nr:hypothetical protein [Thermoleophilia bacterium]
MSSASIDPDWRKRKNAIFWVLWVLLWTLTWFPPLVSWLNSKGSSWSPIMIWVLAMILGQIVVIWIHFFVESRSGELDDTVAAVDWGKLGGRPESSEMFRSGAPGRVRGAVEIGATTASRA